MRNAPGADRRKHNARPPKPLQPAVNEMQTQNQRQLVIKKLEPTAAALRREAAQATSAGAQGLEAVPAGQRGEVGETASDLGQAQVGSGGSVDCGDVVEVIFIE